MVFCCYLTLYYEHTFDNESLGERLDRLPPGPGLAAALSSIDLSKLSGYDRVVVLRAQRKMSSHYAARAYEAMASISDVMHEMDDDYELAHRAAATEIRAGLSLTRRAADAELDLALDLQLRLPRLWEALAGGDVDVPKVKVTVSGTCHLSVAPAREVVEQIIDDAPTLTTGQLRGRIAKLCMAVDPDDARDRYETAVEGRRLVLDANEEATANLTGFDLPADRALAASRKINRLARRLKTRHEIRTMDQLRADVFLDLLEGRPSATRRSHDRGMVDLRVDLTTLIGLDQNGGELAGFGPIVADIARRVADQQQSSEWRWTATDPHTGMPIHRGTTGRRPTTGQRRQVQSRDQTCVFPGCRMGASDCDLDHRIPWAVGGPTHGAFLAPLCRHDHGNRHLCGWTYHPMRDGDYLWTSPLGHRYTTSGKPP